MPPNQIMRNATLARTGKFFRGGGAGQYATYLAAAGLRMMTQGEASDV